MISPHSYSIHTLGQSTNLTSKVFFLFQSMRKSITIAIVHKCFLPKLQLAKNGRTHSYLYTFGWSSQWGGRMASQRRAHHVVKDRLPSVGWGLPPLPHLLHLSNQAQGERRVCHLLRVWAATSRVRHLSKSGAPPKSHVPISSKISSQSIANQLDFVSFDSFLTFAFNFVFDIVPTYLFIFPFADFYWIKMTFLGFWE